MRTRVLIVEDEPEFMRRFSDAVLADPTLHLVGTVSTGQAAKARHPPNARCRTPSRYFAWVGRLLD